MISLDDVNRKLKKKPRLAFLTLRGLKDKPRHQTIGWANDFCRRLADDWYLVREPDVVGTGYHFHALISVKTEQLKRSQFRKGVHTNIRYLAPGNQAKSEGKIFDFPESQDDEDFKKYQHFGEKIFGKDPLNLNTHEKKVIDDIQKKRQVVKQAEASAHLDANIGRVLTYMEKTKPTEQFVDYICNIDGKFCVLKPRIEQTPQM